MAVYRETQMRKRIAWCVVLAGMLGGLTIAAQEPATPVFKSRSDIVQLHVNVFDNKSDAVPELTKDNFLIFEDGRNQEISFFSSEDVPVAVGLVIDNSSSMIAKGRLVVAGAMAFADSSHPEDELFTVHFNEHVRFGLPSGQPFTSSRPVLRSVLAGLRAGGQTALYDAVIEALDHVELSSEQKHVIVVLTDGDDNASQHTKDEMFDRAAESDAIVYTVATNEPRFGGKGDPGTLRKLAQIGGGEAYFPRSEADTVAAFTEIAENIRRGYSIGYIPTNTARDGGYRKIKVMVRAPGRRLTARCRDGYRAPSATSSQ
jgi:Ca-activated chloride channel homolog